MKKKVISILLTLVLCASMLPAAARADGSEFIFDSETGTIRGYTDPNVTELVIPETINGVTVREIGWCAFGRQEKIETTTRYGRQTEVITFEYGSRLSKITIPRTVTKIESGAFYACGELTEINVADKNNSLRSVEGVVYSRDKETIVCCPPGKSGQFNIPQQVSTIGEGAFCDCINLTGITIPAGVEEIEPYAFEGCESLTSITIPNSVTTIGSSAFSNCTSLKSMKLPNGLEKLDYATFQYCESLTNVIIPNGVETIGIYAFASCTSLASLKIPKSVEIIDITAFTNCECLTDIYYEGNKDDWYDIVIGDISYSWSVKDSYFDPEWLSTATIHYNSSFGEFPTKIVIIGSAVLALTGMVFLAVVILRKRKECSVTDPVADNPKAPIAEFCQYCGAKRMNGAKFCTSCGQKLQK